MVLIYIVFSNGRSNEQSFHESDTGVNGVNLNLE